MSDYILHNGELMHFGVKGMKWGVRRYQNKDGSLKPAGKKRQERRDNEKAYREKLGNALKNKNLNESDRKRFEFRNQSYGQRFLKTASRVAATMLVHETLRGGGLDKYANMDKTQLVKELTKKAAIIAGTAASGVALSDSLAKSASKRYDSSGKKLKGSKDHLITKEDAIENGIRAASVIIPIVAIAGGIKMSSVQAKRSANEARFNAWGGKVLEKGIGDLVWQSEDGMYQIFDKQRRGG